MAAKKPKLQHKQAFAILSDRLAKALSSYGYVPHPAWKPGWEPHNQEYEADFLGPVREDGIRIVKCLYLPHGRQLIVEAWHFHCASAESSAAALGSDPQKWGKALISLPWRKAETRDHLGFLSLLTFPKQVKFKADGKPSNLEQIWSAHDKLLQPTLDQIHQEVRDPARFNSPLAATAEN
ncbi:MULTISPECIES: hypothetical protein [unclassified Leisingera]|uniref:hypothetical protein n=1 Tax=unclassified Leisingera TaxID=2614906 RepID=UPI001269F073|nr:MULTISPECIES: hypothetical protein [unclassified Leisingera]